MIELRKTRVWLLTFALAQLVVSAPLSATTNEADLADDGLLFPNKAALTEPKVEDAADLKAEKSLETQPEIKVESEPTATTEPEKVALKTKKQAKTILDLQNQSVKFEEKLTGGLTGSVELVNINKVINIWYLLTIKSSKSELNGTFHLENRHPHAAEFSLSKGGLAWKKGQKSGVCPLWSAEQSVKQATKSGKAYAAVCNDLLYVRNVTKGKESAKEWVADFLRKNVWGGEQITTLVKDMLYKDRFLILSTLSPKEQLAAKGDQPKITKLNEPRPALIAAEFQGIEIERKDLGLSLGKFEDKKKNLPVGVWMESLAREGVFISVMQPGMVDKSLRESFKSRVRKMDPVEAAAAVYSVAFDLDKFGLEFALGTKHPSLEWSARALDKIKNNGTAGPDGINSASPLIATGLVNPDVAPKVIASFTGGFKRSHGAFKWGELSQKNGGSHYGFIENGVVFSKLNEGLATLVIYEDGEIDMKMWEDSDNLSLRRIKHARQNGVPILYFEPDSRSGLPHELVGSWGKGNWSGSVDSKQRALRAGACLQRQGSKTFLIYSYFSSATPNAMARVFQSYGCDFAMHLDMNALEHTYLALYSYDGSGLDIEHLISGMDVLDTKIKDKVIPRFVGAADNRDFFYLIKR